MSRSKLGIQTAITILGFVGMGISSYLTYIHYQWVEPICGMGLDCNSVLFSHYAQIWSLPISLLGFLMYALITVCGLLLLWKRKEGLSLLALGIYVIALSGTLYSGYLTYRELFSLHAFCSWCIGSALTIISILVLSLFNLSTSGSHPAEIPHLTNIKLSRCIQR